MPRVPAREGSFVGNDSGWKVSDEREYQTPKGQRNQDTTLLCQQVRKLNLKYQYCTMLHQYGTVVSKRHQPV